MENTGRAIIATMGWGDFRAFAIVYATSATFIAVKTRKMKDFLFKLSEKNQPFYAMNYMYSYSILEMRNIKYC